MNAILDRIYARKHNIPRTLSRINRHRYATFIVSNLILKYSWILYFIGFLSILLLPLPALHKKIYFDENALLTNEANRLFSHSDASNTISYKHDAQNFISLDSISRSRYFEKVFHSIGLDSSTQSFNYTRNKKIYSGVNTYAILRAPRSDGTESILLSAPFKSFNSQDNLHATAILTSFAKFISSIFILTKDTLIYLKM